MSRRTKSNSKQSARVASGIAVAAAAGKTAVTLTTAANPYLAALSAVFTVFPPLLSASLPLLFERKKRAAEDWWRAVVEDTSTEIAVAILIDTKKDDPDCQEVLFTAFREALNAVSDGAIRPLGLLTREYVQAGRSADAFFRGLGRLLADASSAEIAALKRMLSMAASGNDHASLVRLELVGRPYGQHAALRIQATVPGLSDLQVKGREVDSDDNTARLFYLLKTHGLGHDTPGGAWGVTTGPSVLVLEHSVLCRVLRYLI